MPPRISRYRLVLGDVGEVVRDLLEPASFHGCLCDPPYGLSFMGKRWDYAVPSVETWREVAGVLVPGAHLLAFAGTRTQHRMTVNIEDAGFEIRDMIAWVYGCLDEVTEVATENGVMPHHKTKIGDRVLCYDVEHGEYTYQPILEIVEYDYSDTAYRLVGDFGEQVVSRNHRVIVERGGREAFRLAETLECEARVPVLESLPALRQAVHDAHQGAGRPQQDMQCGMCEFVDRRGECRGDAAGTTQGFDDPVRDLRGERVEAGRLAAQSGDADVQQEVQRRAARCGVGEACAQRSGALVGRVGGGAEGAHDGRVQPSLERGFDIPQPEGGLRRSADQVRAMPCRCDGHGSGGRLCHGASSCGGTGGWETADASGVRASHQPRCDGQSAGEPDAVCDERAAQGVRAWGGHRSAVVRVVPFHYTGKVWCLRVPTGAFVAVRNGLAFPTGNSGFPKSLDVSKAIDKAARATRKVVGPDPYSRRHNKATPRFTGTQYANGKEWQGLQTVMRTAPASLSSAQWQGYGTALKPALEPITVARKPLRGTVAANCLEYGAGAINIDGCKVGNGERTYLPRGTSASAAMVRVPERRAGKAGEEVTTRGRWPANLIHDGSEEVERLTGSAARFFYCAKASRSEREAGLRGKTTGGAQGVRPGSPDPSGKFPDHDHRERGGNNHPTVKPLALAEYLARLILPPKLDKPRRLLVPFCGSGSEIIGALRAGWDEIVGIDLEESYLEIAKARIDHYLKGAA